MEVDILNRVLDDVLVVIIVQEGKVLAQLVDATYSGHNTLVVNQFDELVW